MSEESLWQWLRGKLPAAGHYTRIESDCSAGFPDVHYTLPGGSGTLELKFARNPRSLHPFKRRGLRTSQEIWIEDEVRAGGRVLIVAEITPRVFIVEGYWAHLFNDWSELDIEGHSELILRKRFVDVDEQVRLRKLLEKKPAPR
jgi:hypothetical protein